MGCEIIAIDQGVNCSASDGGIFTSWATQQANIISIAFDAITGEVTAILHTAAWDMFVYDDDDSAFYNQEGERTNNKVTVTQEAFLKFSGADITKVHAANVIKDCCATIWIHQLNSGASLLQGIDRDVHDLTPVVAGTNLLLSKKKAKVTPNVMSDTGDNEDRTEYNISSVGRYYSMTVADSVVALLGGPNLA